MEERRLEILLVALALASALYGFSDVPGWFAHEGFRNVPREPDVLRIVTWNVGRSVDGGRPLADDAIGHVVGVLTELSPNVVLLQEVAVETQARRIGESLGSEWKRWISVGADRRLAILARGGSIIRRTDAGRLLEVEWRRSPNRRIAIVNAHAHAYSSRRRNQLIGGAVLMMDRRAAPLKIFAGDFNFDVDLDRRRDLFTDDEHLDVETYNFVAQRFTDATLGTGSTAEPDRRLDYIFVSGDAVDVVRSGPWKGRRFRGMDHDPVVADILCRGCAPAQR
ncbi:MAG: hypothetical protein CMJ18_09510 [Phycisphaeraceae bacterium]|nr:hypothetical protein [Phycisphaeraceae bacterium]